MPEREERRETACARKMKKKGRLPWQRVASSSNMQRKGKKEVRLRGARERRFNLLRRRKGFKIFFFFVNRKRRSVQFSKRLFGEEMKKKNGVEDL